MSSSLTAPAQSMPFVILRFTLCLAMATWHFFSSTTFTFTSNKLSEFFPCSVFPQPKVSYQTRLGCTLQISRLNYKITDSQRHLPVVSCAVLCCGQTGRSVGSEVHLLAKVEDADVIVVIAIIWMNNQLLHFDDQLWQKSFALLLSVMLSECDLIMEFKTIHTDKSNW